MPHVTIDRDGCISCGTCWLECGEVFEENPEDHKSQVAEQFSGGAPGEGDVPDDLADCVQRSADACPVTVIAVG